MLKQSRNLKGTGLYINEHLIKKNAEIAGNASMLGKKTRFKTHGQGMGECLLNGPPEQAKVFVLWEL